MIEQNVIIQKNLESYSNFNNDDIIDFGDNNTTDSFKLKKKPKKTGQTGRDGTKNFKIKVPLKYLSNFLQNP